MWFNENSDFYYKYIHGDKETFHLAFRRMKQSYSLVKKPIQSLAGTMCQHDFAGRRVFQHRNMDKWNLFLRNRNVEDFQYEKQCRGLVRRLRLLWDGRIDRQTANKFQIRRKVKTKKGRLKIEAVMVSCDQRERLRLRTLRNLAATDWGALPVRVQLDRSMAEDRRKRQTACAYQGLVQSLGRDFDYLLFLEDDLEFNRHIRHNLQNWKPLRSMVVTVASVYNPSVREFGCDAHANALLVDPACVFGSQAFLISKPAVEYVVRHWNTVRGMQDIRISRLAGRLGSPFFYHAPSLVQHMGKRSTWGGRFHRAVDFNPNWRA